MAYTWAQKKAVMQELIEEYYAPPLREAGFVSYKNEGFHWYRIKGELFQTVRMPIFSPSSPIYLDVGFGAVPLFTWEHIAPSGPSRDFDWDLRDGSDHFTSATNLPNVALAETILGKLPRRSYFPTVYRYVEDGPLIGHMNSERCGGEAVDELMLPLLDTMLTVEDVYRWNKKARMIPWSSSSDEELIKALENMYLDQYKGIDFLSLAFADECIYCRDEKFYPILLYYLKETLDLRACPPFPPRTKEEAVERAEDIAHTQVLIKVLETGDRELFDAELAKQKERMLAQIRKKLPEMKW